MQAAVSGAYFLEKGLAELNSTIFKDYKLARKSVL